MSEIFIGKPVRKGEELFLDYGQKYWNGAEAGVSYHLSSKMISLNA